MPGERVLPIEDYGSRAEMRPHRHTPTVAQVTSTSNALKELIAQNLMSGLEPNSNNSQADEKRGFAKGLKFALYNLGYDLEAKQAHSNAMDEVSEVLSQGQR